MDGIINIFKPKGITSHDAVSIMRRILGIKKVGHTGTLDPNATGVLPLCVGKGTRISEYLLDVDKEYVGELTLGLATDTQDSDGKILKQSYNEVSRDDIYKAFDKFKGEIQQIPPMYSALRYNGKKLYELAREGKVVDRKARNVNIYNLDIIDILDNKKVIFYAKCSKGTYIRTLCDDIGECLGTYGHMSYLIRVGVGDFKIANSYSIDYIKGLDQEQLKTIFTPIDQGLGDINSLIVEDQLLKKLTNGVIVPLVKDVTKDYGENTPIKVYCKNTFIGIGKIIEKNNKTYIKMHKVFV